MFSFEQLLEFVQEFGLISELAALAMPSLEAIFTKSAREPAFILFNTLPRCAFTVISLIPSSPRTCFNRPEATNTMTCRSGGVSAA